MEERDHDSWKDWFQLYGPKLLLCARQWTHSAADAEDVVQEAFVRFWQRQRHLGGDPMPLLVTSARRAALDLARTNQRRSRREADAGDALDAPLFETKLENDEQRAAIEEALRQLVPEQREVLVLKIWAELTFEQIGRELDIPANTAASRYRYALVALRQRLIPAARHG
jgi:RNA polymerase sigma-70 factor (ECF subfamily)